MNQKNKSRKASILIFLFMFIFITLFVLSLFYKTLLWDENVYLGNARSHIMHSNFTEDFRFPLLEYLIACIWMITGESILAAKLLVISLAAVSAVLFYLILEQLFGKNKYWKSRILFALLFGLSPLILFWGFRVYADIPSLAFVLGSIYFAVKSQEGNSNTNTNAKKLVWIALAGLLSSLAFLTRFSSAIIAFSILVFLISNKDKKSVVIFIIASIIPLVPWIVYNYAVYKNPLWDVFAYQNAINIWTQNEPIIKEIKNIIASANFLLLFLIPGAFYFIRKIKEEFTTNKSKIFSFVMFYFIISLAYYTFFVKLKDERYILAILPAILIISYSGYLLMISRIEQANKKYLKKLLAISLLLIFMVTIITDIGVFSLSYKCSGENAVTLSFSYIEENKLLKENDVFLSNYWPYYAYHFNAVAYSLWNPNLTEMIKQYSPKMIIIKENDGTEYNLTAIESNQQVIFDKKFSDGCNNRIRLYSVSQK